MRSWQPLAVAAVGLGTGNSTGPTDCDDDELLAER